MNFFIKHKWKIYSLAIGVFSTIVFAFVLISYQSTEETTSFVEAVKASLLGLGGIGVISTVLLSAFNSMEDSYMRVVENTYIHITKWDDPHLALARKFTRKLKETKPNMSDKEFLELINADEELRHSIILVCNYFEQVRISVKMKRIDIELFNSSLGVVMGDYYHTLKPYAYSLGPQGARDWDVVQSLSKVGQGNSVA